MTRVAIVHDRLTEQGGSERVLEELHRLWPDAPIFSALIDPDAVPESLQDADLRPSRLQRHYRSGPGYAHLLPRLAPALAKLDLSGFDLVVASHSAFANRVRPPTGVPVVSYVYTPARWMWEARARRGEPGGLPGRVVLAAYAATQRAPDRAAAGRARGLVAISRTVASRIERWWGRPAAVVHPPVDVDWFTPDSSVAREDFFLFAGRLVPRKEPLIAARAAHDAGARLVIVGEGRLRGALERVASSGTEMLGRVDDEELRGLYRRCRALVFPGEEDFGLVPLEAQACGAPVIALGAGGALETVVDGVTGRFYPPASSDPSDTSKDVPALSRRLSASSIPGTFDAGVIRRHAEGFRPERFRSELRDAFAALLGFPVA